MNVGRVDLTVSGVDCSSRMHLHGLCSRVATSVEQMVGGQAGEVFR